MGNSFDNHKKLMGEIGMDTSFKSDTIAENWGRVRKAAGKYNTAKESVEPIDVDDPDVKEMGIIPEASPITSLEDASRIKKVVNTIAKYTDQNAHNFAAIELAKFLGDKGHIAVMNHINGIHEIIGHMPHGLILTRSGVIDDMLKMVETKYDKNVRDAFSGAF